MPQKLSNLVKGSKIKFGRYSPYPSTPLADIEWVIVAKNHTGYPNNSITLFTSKVIDADIVFDASEVDATSPTGERNSGSSVYKGSNVDQWLNAEGGVGGEWFDYAHDMDELADGVNNVTSGFCNYYAKPGFLNGFTASEKSLIQTTQIKSDYYEGYYPSELTLERKVFLPSLKEIHPPTATINGTYITEGTSWGYFTGTESEKAVTTPQARAEAQHLGLAPNTTLRWLTRSHAYAESVYVCGDTYTIWPCDEGTGLRVALNLTGDALVSDYLDADGCYTMSFNTAPTVPNNISVPSRLYGGRTNTISWNPAVDIDGDAVTYELECAYNGGEFSVVYSGDACSYNHVIPFGETSAQYRVRAVDTQGDYGGYITSEVTAIINNNAPTISGSDGDLGVMSNQFSQGYSVSDADGGSLTVTEKIDGVTIRTFVATAGDNLMVNVLGETWLKLSNGGHTLSIVVTDKYGDTDTRNYVFTKRVTSCSVRTSPMVSSGLPSLVWVTVSRRIPSGAIFKVEVCNNAADTEPTWEDATTAVLNNEAYQFTNKNKTSDTWAVGVRVSIDRNGAEGECYINEIGGNFE
jgi:hypothetical protein